MSTDESRSPSPTPSELKLQWRLAKKREDRKKEIAAKKSREEERRRTNEEKKRAEEERAARKAKIEKRKATDEAAQGADAPCKRVRIEAVDPIPGPSSATGIWETAKEPCNRCKSLSIKCVRLERRIACLGCFKRKVKCEGMTVVKGAKSVAAAESSGAMPDEELVGLLKRMTKAIEVMGDDVYRMRLAIQDRYSMKSPEAW